MNENVVTNLRVCVCVCLCIFMWVGGGQKFVRFEMCYIIRRQGDCC